MHKLLLLAGFFVSCYPIVTPNQPTNNYNNNVYNNGENPPTSQPANNYPTKSGNYGITTTPEPSEGGYGITTPNLGPNATYSCEAKCNDSKTAVTCQGSSTCNAWCDDYNVPHAECK
jgi:hypothetical protein